MDKGIIQKIQDRILRLLPANKRFMAGVLLRDSCSEVSRLVAGWIQEINNSNKISIIKGVNVRGTRESHDIIVVLTLTGDIYVIDPTIWQFFPKTESILLFISDNIRDVLEKIKAMYGGRWSISEENIKISKDDKNNYIAIIEKNINENLGISGY